MMPNSIGNVKNRWLIALSAVFIHISIGSVYAWSVFTKPIVDFCQWGFKDVQLTFSIAILFLGLSAAFMGYFVETKGPRKSGTLASVFFGLGLIGTGLAINLKSIYLMYFCYGVIGGIGLGIGYISPVSTLVKWFPDKRGLATGLAIMGFGFASLIASPIIQNLIVSIGLANTFFTLGISYFIIIFISAQYLSPPLQGWIPTGYRTNSNVHKKKPQDYIIQLTANEAARTRRFYLLWIMLFINITCGIALISVASPMGQEICDMTPFQAAMMVGLIGLFNGGGRIIWAALSDYIGRTNIYTLLFSIQLISMFILPMTSNIILFQIFLFLVMTCYGGGFACIPAYIGDLFGTKQLGAIHGYILTAWALSGILAPTLTAWIHEKTGSYSQTMNIFIILFAIALIISFIIRIDIRNLKMKAGIDKEAKVNISRSLNEQDFPAKISETRNVIEFVLHYAQRANLSQDKLNSIELAVEEAALNICKYADLEETAVNLTSYAYCDKGKFLVRIENNTSAFKVSLIDSGKAFNPLTIGTPNLNGSLEDRKLGGLGIHLMRSVVDDIHYSRNNNLNVLTLIINK